MFTNKLWGAVRRKCDAIIMVTLIVAIGLVSWRAWSDSPPAERAVVAPHAVRVSVKMIGPVTQTTDIQMICVLKHDPVVGDKYIEAMDDLNKKLGGLLSSLRERGEFAGEPGETLLFTPPPNSITPMRVLLIGVGDEATLTLDRLKLAGRIAAREATRLGASDVSWAPTLRDQGSTRIDVGDGDAAFAEGFVLAYDTEARLQAQGLASKSQLKSLTIEAGPKYFEGASAKVSAAVAAAGEQVKQRKAEPYRGNGDR
jgi:hypothetical protein